MTPYLPVFYKRWCVIINDTNKNLMNIIKIFNGCIFIRKFDDVPVILDAQPRPICEVHSIMVAGVFSV